MTATLPHGITDGEDFDRLARRDQARGIVALCAVLARPVPDLFYLTHKAAGDLIMSLRAETRGER